MRWCVDMDDSHFCAGRETKKGVWKGFTSVGLDFEHHNQAAEIAVLFGF
jgi:hypothetical protein